MLIGRLRAVSGCVLLAYVVTHLSNHALGLWSLQAADAWLEILSTVWRWPPVTVLLSTALAVHAGAALHALWRRRTWRLGRWEWAQLLLGLSIVPLAMTHVIGTRVAHELHGVHTNHFWVLWPMAVDPWQNARQCALVIVVWLHACIGVHFWWRLKPWYPHVMPWLYALALLLPAMALAGAGVALGSVLMMLEDPVKMKAAIAAVHPPSRAEVADLHRLSDALKLLALALLAGTLLARQVRDWVLRRSRGLRLHYAGGPQVALPAGGTLLEASRRFGVPHASVCGGRGRCSTCRVHVSGPDAHQLPTPDGSETTVLQRVGAGAGVRLACQLKPPPGTYRVLPLLPPDAAQPADAYRGTASAAGDERIVVVMFVDLRGFTALSERRLPFDVVFLLNRYFRAAGESVERAGGRVDKFIGDGMMALFGLQSAPPLAARQALQASRQLGEALTRLNADLAGELQEPLRIGIGLHLGPAIVGVLGHGPATGLTAIGDTVNTASRLESLSKELGVTLVASQAVWDAAALGSAVGQPQDVLIRGRTEPLAVRAVSDLQALPSS
jgi:adenylate cyclase